jgi:hypothetical protein
MLLRGYIVATKQAGNRERNLIEIETEIKK